MSALAQFCYRRRRAVLVAWILAVVGFAAAAWALGTAFTTAADLPDSESSRAYALMAEAGMSSDTSSGTIVWRAEGSAIDAPAVRAEAAAMLDEIAALPGVEAVVGPYSEAGVAQVNPVVSTAFATVTTTDDVDVEQVREVVDSYDTAALEVAAGGQAFSEMPAPSHGTEAIGIIAALAILLLVFRSGWAAALPILTGVTGVGTSLLAVSVGAHVVDLDATSLTMGALIGLGVGIDDATSAPVGTPTREYAELMAPAFRTPYMAPEFVRGQGRVLIS